MKVLSNLTIKNLKLNKSRTIVTIIGIILSTAMLVCVCTLLSSVLGSYKQEIIALEGDYHVSFSRVPAEKVNQIALHQQVEKCFITEKRSDLTSQLLKSPTESSIWAFDENSLKENESLLIKGRLPQNENEILIRQGSYFTKIVEVGDSIPLSDGKTYTVVGKMSGSKSMFNYSVITMLMSEPKSKVEIAVKLKDSSKLESFMGSVNQGGKLFNFSKNDLLLSAENFTQMFDYSDDSNMFYFLLFYAAFILLCVIVAVGAFCIRNSFAISINEKIRQYAMLASVGATRKQIKQNILLESFILGAIAIPIGAALGTLSSFVLIQLAKIFFNFEFKFVFFVTTSALVVSILMSMLTIFLSSITVAVRVSKTCEIDAIRNTNEIKSTRRNTKTPKIIEEFFGIGGVFAFKNIKRNKRKFRVTTLTLVVSIVAFITVSYSLNFFPEMKMNEYSLGDDVDLSVGGDDVGSCLDYILDLDGIKEYTITYLSHKTLKPIESEVYYRPINVVTLNQEAYDRYLQENSIAHDENKVIVFDRIQIWDENSKRITVDYLDYTGQKDNFQIGGIQDSFEYVRVAVRPMGFSDYVFDSTINVLMSPTQFEKYIKYDFETNAAYGIGEVYIDLYAKCDYVYSTENLITQYARENSRNCFAKNYVQVRKDTESMFFLIEIVSYLFIAVIISVGLTSIYNSLSANINLRRKEFAMLQSIGMTSEEFNKMISFECAFYVLKSLLIGVPIALVLTFCIFTSAVNGNTSYTYNLPIMQIISCAVVVFFVVYGIMKSSLNKIAKQNVIETIRRENV